MKLDQFLVGLIIFSVFMVGGSLIFNSMVKTYDVSTDMSLFNGSNNTNGDNSVYDILDEMDSEITDNLQEKIVGDESSSSSDNAVDVLISSGYSAITLVSKSFGLVNAIIINIGMTIGLPGWLVGALFMIFIILIIFTIIYLIFRLNQ